MPPIQPSALNLPSTDVLSILFPILAKGLEPFLDQRVPAAIQSFSANHRPSWLQAVQIHDVAGEGKGGIRLVRPDASPPVVTGCQLDGDRAAVLIKVVWRPSLDSKLRVIQRDGGGVDVTVVSAEVKVTVRVALGAGGHGNRGMSFAQPIGLDFFLTAQNGTGKRNAEGCRLLFL